MGQGTLTEDLINTETEKGGWRLHEWASLRADCLTLALSLTAVDVCQALLQEPSFHVLGAAYKCSSSKEQEGERWCLRQAWE